MQNLQQGLSRRNRPKITNIKLTEKDVVAACISFLELDGWRPIKMEPISRREWGKGTGEIGQPDWIFLRYDTDRGESLAPSGEILWIEMKAPGRKPTASQLAWHARERARGGGVLVVDDPDKFIAQYCASELARRVRK